MLFPGEVEAVRTMLKFGALYGYGNLIAHLRREWALKLMEDNPNLTFELACHATIVDPYPELWSIDEIVSANRGQ